MDNLSDRQKLILGLVVREYTRSAMPVSSQSLVDTYRLEMSSATIRNELAALTDYGYLRQPHTSAGRIPTEEGFRYFVGHMLNENDLPDTTQRTISYQFHQMEQDVDQWMRLAASVLAHQSHAASVVTAPHPEISRLKHLELISTRGHQVLMVLVLVGGEIHQRIFTINELMSQDALSSIANRLSNQFGGKDARMIDEQKAQLPPLEQDLIIQVVEEMRRADRLVAGELFMDGVTNVLSEPEFAGTEDARRALRLLEERTLLNEMLSHPLAKNNLGGVHVLIGGEGIWNELRQFSFVMARYGMPGMAMGTLGVLGPMRMPYGRTISTVRYLSGLLSELVTETLVE
ncbi:MAG TPA: heat-inducible transcriptional repressor HrcA [Anaerolineaceae bacterium]